MIDIKTAFNDCYNADKTKYIKKWLVGWEVSQEHHKYNGEKDFITWFERSTKYVGKHYFYDNLNPLVEKSHSYHKKLVNKLNLDIDIDKYKDFSVYNAQDYLFQNLYPVPDRMEIKHVLDFGAGYGRQANLWTQLRDDVVYVAMDAIEAPYCMQYLYYQFLEKPFHDYVEEKDKFEINDDPGIYHLPTWRKDLLPHNFFDMIICVQVLQELNARLVREMVKTFHEVLKPGGALYIRDHDQAWKPAHLINLNDYLKKKGFVLEFRPHVIDKEDIHGIPRIWRKIDSKVEKSQKLTAQKFLKFGGYLSKVMEKIRNNS